MTGFRGASDLDTLLDGSDVPVKFIPSAPNGALTRVFRAPI